MTKISRETKHLVMLPACALFFFIGAVTVQAATYYVATTGNDAHACATAQTVTTPKRTIASGVACLYPGDTLYMRAGTYGESINVVGKDGAAGSIITIAGYPGETVTIAPTNGGRAIFTDASYITFDHMVWDGVNHTEGTNGNIIASGSHHLTFNDLEIKNWHYNGLYFEGDNFTVTNSRIHDQKSPTCVVGTRFYGLYFHHGTNGVIDGNDVYNNPGGGVQAYPGTITNLIIRNNKIHDNNSCTTSQVGGIVVSSSTSEVITNMSIYNNLVYKNGSSPASGLSTGIRVDNGPTGTKLWNNTVYGNKGWGIVIDKPDTTNTFAQNNIVFANTLGQIANAGTGSILDHNLTTDPYFVNAAALNFNLQTSSPAIDAGVSLSQVPTDFKKTPRPQGTAYDIGAYEVGTGSDSVPPVPPSGLRVN